MHRASLVVAAVVLALAATLPIARGQGAATSGADTSRERPHVLALVRGLRSDRGRVRGAIYPSAERFTHEGQGTATCAVLIVRGLARCRFYDVPAGRYAIGVMHDEDDDDHFDQGFMGIPEEGYGFSRDAHGTLGPPSFESAAFDYDGISVLRKTITMRYGI